MVAVLGKPMPGGKVGSTRITKKGVFVPKENNPMVNNNWKIVLEESKEDDKLPTTFEDGQTITRKVGPWLLTVEAETSEEFSEALSNLMAFCMTVIPAWLRDHAQVRLTLGRNVWEGTLGELILAASEAEGEGVCVACYLALTDASRLLPRTPRLNPQIQ